MRETLQSGWRALEHGFDAAFGAALNPLRHLGALGFLMFWLLAASGIYLYAVLDTSAEGAWHSIDALSRQQWYLGGVLRSLHRYAADAFVLLMLAHLLREWLFGHWQGFRRFSWLTGVPLLLFAFVSAIGGFWLNWDQLGQFSAIATAEWLDWLPLFATPLTRNFLNAAAVSDRLFSLFVFIHLGVPLLLVFGLWFHIQRISRAAVFPPRVLAAGSFAALLALAVAQPVMSQAPANLALVPGPLAFDWLLLFVHPLVNASSAGVVWWLLSATLVALFALPFLPRRSVPVPVAVVDAANCNGCRRCFDDCPYAAVTMIPHPNKRIGREMAQVNADLCASCGICVGACPSSTPFRSVAELVTGIDMPSAPISALRRQLQQALAAKDTFDFLGSPEGELALAQVTVYLATAPKSNAAYVAYKAAMRMAKESGSLPPPKHILNAPSGMMAEQGYGADYAYDHDAPDAFSGQNYFPDGMQRQEFYEPTGRGFESELKRRLTHWAKLRADRGGE